MLFHGITFWEVVINVPHKEKVFAIILNVNRFLLWRSSQSVYYGNLHWDSLIGEHKDDGNGAGELHR